MNEQGKYYCPICGREAADPNLRRFGEYFCSDDHVTEYAQEVRARVGKGVAAVGADAGAAGQHVLRMHGGRGPGMMRRMPMMR